MYTHDTPSKGFLAMAYKLSTLNNLSIQSIQYLKCVLNISVTLLNNT